MSDKNVVIDASLRLVSRALDEYTHWHTELVRKFFYPETEMVMAASEPPPAFVDLQELLKSVPELAVGDIERVFKTAIDVHDMAARITASIPDKGTPNLEEFNEFSLAYDDFIGRLLNVERQQYFAGNGYDPVMGLRSGETMFGDLSREIERMSRWGYSLLAILVRLETTDALPPVIQKKVGEGIIASIRNFDDAYKMNDREVFMLLKNADNHAGYSVITRMREFFTAANAENGVENGEKIVLPGFSFCLAEPYDSEEPEKLLQMMRDDLTENGQRDPKPVILHQEESPLRRYIRDMQKKG